MDQTEVFEERQHNRQFKRMYLGVFSMLFFLYLVFLYLNALDWCKTQEVLPGSVFVYSLLSEPFVFTLSIT